jgi:hypothetical protein
MLRPQETSAIEQLENTAMAVVENVCGIVARPLELPLRPWHGTRYFSVPVVFFSTMLMIFLPLFSALATGAMRMIPFLNIPAPVGIFSLGSLAKLYFLLSMAHGVRLWRRILHPELEMISTFEGPPLPILQLFPKSNNFWITRIITEPCLVFFVATALGRIYVFQTGLTLYLQLAALALAMKEFITFYRAWEYLRDLLDAKALGPIISDMLSNRATAEALASIHIAALPRNVSPDIRDATLSNIARVFSPEAEPPAAAQ